MSELESFYTDLDVNAGKFKAWLNNESFFSIYSHFDADGLSSAAVLINFLKSHGKLFHLTVLEQLTEDEIKKIPLKGSVLVFLDFGSGQLRKLSEFFSDRKVLILDHHQPQGEVNTGNVIHVNPCIQGLDGGALVSASGVTYLFLKRLGANNMMASFALIGASGDVQELTASINSSILRDSILEERKDLNIYGLNVRPIHKALEYTDAGFIPGVSGDETGAVNFLNELRIPLKKGEEWRTIGDLTSKEKQDLISGIIVKRGGDSEVFRTVYELSIGRKRGIDEWASILNACGRMGLPSVGVSALLNPEYESSVDEILRGYKNLIVDGLNWLESNTRNPDFVRETDKAFYFIAGDAINYKIVGTLCSIKSSGLNKEFIIGLANNGEVTKVSVRKTGVTSLKASDLVIQAVLGIGEGGGHMQAAGASIKKGSEFTFIEAFEKALNNPLLNVPL